MYFVYFWKMIVHYACVMCQKNVAVTIINTINRASTKSVLNCTKFGPTGYGQCNDLGAHNL